MDLVKFQQVKNLIQVAIDEDIGHGDVTTESTILKGSISQAKLVTKDEIILAGIEIFIEVYKTLDSSVEIKKYKEDGEFLSSMALIAEIKGETRSLLAGERVALNFLQRISGIATTTRKYVEAVRGYDVTIVDTRKTTPGWRLLEKYAVRVGGGKNHRYDLGDGILIKDNHIVSAGSIMNAVEAVRKKSHHLLKIEVEVETIDQVQEALDAGAEVIMLDNMSLAMLAEGVEKIGGRALVEASGGISLENIACVAQTGVDLISVGRLTHSASAVDIHIEFDSPTFFPCSAVR